MLDIKIEKTADGSHTFFVPELNEHYHSVNGALTESEHVFIKAGLRQFNAGPVSILEIGFGTGLNAFLSFLDANNRKIQIDYTTIELYPIEKELIKQLNFSEQLHIGDNSVFYNLHDCEWGNRIKINDLFYILKLKEDFTKISLNQSFDIIYFDAFAPDKQPEMWTQKIFTYLFEHTNENGILTTYCAKGAVRRMLQTAGYVTERLPGPPGKREMLRAKKSIKVPSLPLL